MTLDSVRIACCWLAAWAGMTMAQGQHSRDEGEAGQLERLKKEVRQLSLDLSEAKGIVTSIKEKAVRDRLYKSIARMEQRCSDITRQVGRIRLTPALAVQSIAEADLTRFIESMRPLGFDDKKATSLRQFVMFHHFTCEQTVKVLKQFAFGDGQVQAAVLMHPRITDPQNFYQVLAAMTFESDRDRVRKALKMQ